MKTGIRVIAGFILFIVLVFSLELLGLGFFKFFEPRKENIRREVYENTKSFTHGKIQELSKYYREYNEGSAEDRQVIANVIRAQFYDFDASKINNVKLQQFLINVRGY